MTRSDVMLKNDIYNILTYGVKDENPRPRYLDGTSAHTYFVTHSMRQYNLCNGDFPICTLRPIAWKSAIKEILWIYQKKRNSLDVLKHEYGINYWDEWESKTYPNTIGKTYGYIIDKYDLFNKRVLEDIKNNPYGRYHVCSMWQEEVFNEPDFEVQYAALLMMVAKATGYKPGKFTHFVANEQIYDRHIDVAKELMRRCDSLATTDEHYKYKYNNVKMEFTPKTNNFYDFTINDFKLIGYEPMKPQLKLDLGI